MLYLPMCIFTFIIRYDVRVHNAWYTVLYGWLHRSRALYYRAVQSAVLQP